MQDLTCSTCLRGKDLSHADLRGQYFYLSQSKKAKLFEEQVRREAQRIVAPGSCGEPAKEIFAFSKRPTPLGKSTWRGLQGWTYLTLDFPVGIRAMGIEVSDPSSPQVVSEHI